MTEQQLRARLVETAVSFLGASEADGGHRTIIDIYNRLRPLPRGYAMTYDDAWCAAFVSAAASEAGLTELLPAECGCEKMVELYRELGRWVERDDYVPSPGDLIFYDWGDPGSGDDLGFSDHVGIVVSVNGDVITTVEGNVSDRVAYRSICVNARTIRGFATPDYASFVQLTDIGEPSEWAYTSCRRAVRSGIVHGDGHGDWGWQRPLTLEQLCVILDSLELLNGGEK